MSLNVISLNKAELNGIGDFGKRPTTPIEYDEVYDANEERLYDVNDLRVMVKKYDI